jgi:hypothetical protein
MECSFTVGVHTETEEDLREWAMYEGVSIAHIVRRAVEQALKARHERMAQVDLFQYARPGEGISPSPKVGAEPLFMGEGL